MVSGTGTPPPQRTRGGNPPRGGHDGAPPARSLRVGLALASALALSACSLGLTHRSELGDRASGEKAHVDAGPLRTDPPRPLSGVDTSALDESEQKVFWTLANQVYAPCKSQAVSLVQCIEEKRDCSSCAPAAELLVAQVDRGTPRASAAAAVKVRFDDDEVRPVQERDSPARGAEGAPIRVVIFSDFQCPACGATVPMLEELLAKHPNDVRLVHKFYPLKQHPRAREAAKAAFAAQKQGKYWPMEKLIFEHQDALSDEDLEGYAAKVGLDLERYRIDRASEEAEQTIERDLDDGEQAGVRHTPFVLVNGRLFDPKLFRYDRDFETWLATEKALLAQKAAQKKAGPEKPAPEKPAPESVSAP